MIIDWITVVAQAVNFLILVWLMKRFLFKPVLNAIEDREKRIAAELADADQKKAEAQKEREAFQYKNAAFDQQRADLLDKAREEAQAERERLLGEARQAATGLSLKLQETMRNEEHSLLQAIGLRTQQEVFAIARKVMTDLAGTSLEERMVELFVRRLHDLAVKEKEQLVSALKTPVEPVTVRTSLDLPPAQRKSAEGAIKEILGPDTPVRFETAPELIGGIELAGNGQKVAWSIADYLASLEKSVDELLKERDKPKNKAGHEITRSQAT